MKWIASIMSTIALLVSSPVFAQDWSPTPMVIDAAERVPFYDNGDDILIPFSLSGKDAKIWVVIESKLYDDIYYGKPVAVRNGLRGWHYVNGIDTTIYVSAARMYEPGSDLIFPIGTRGNDQSAKVSPSSDTVFSPIEREVYTFYLWGYDYHSDDYELAVDFLPIGSYWEGQFLKFYPYDETGASYQTPMLMGQLPFFLTSESTPVPGLIENATIVRWRLGQNPLDYTLLETSRVRGFEADETDRPFDEGMVGYGAGIFDPRDHDVYYFSKNFPWEQNQTVVKYVYVADGEAVEDTDWGGYDNVEWYHPATQGDYSVHSVLYNFEDEYLAMLDGGTNPMSGQHDRLHVFSIDDPTDEPVNIPLDEFYMPNQPVNPSDGELRTSSQLNQLAPGLREGTFFISGAYSCLTELIDINGLIDEEGELDPYTDDGSGYVIWANSNGDYFFDMSPYADPDNPDQLWACIVSEPENANNPRHDLQPADMHGFLVSFTEFTGVNSFGIYCPDGTGIDLAGFYDTTFIYRTGIEEMSGGGEILDYGGQFDGLYMLEPVLNEGEYGNEANLKTIWVAFDSDKGYLTAYNDYYIEFGPPQDDHVSIHEDSPEPFTVFQNSPNPFNPSTSITFSLAESGPVKVEIYNVAGQAVETLVDADMDAGSHTVIWNAEGFPAGVYFYAVRSGGYAKTMKMTLVK